jgi:hypothetical protein
LEQWIHALAVKANLILGPSTEPEFAIHAQQSTPTRYTGS